MKYQYLLKNDECVLQVSCDNIVTEQSILKCINAQLAEGELPYTQAERVKKGQCICPYCHLNIVDSPDTNVLCDECREVFGHSFYSEL